MSRAERYIIDGEAFGTLEQFAAHFSDRVLQGYRWSGNLDAFNDILRGGFGTPENGFTLVWRRSQVSRERLGYPETVRQLEQRLATCHPENRPHIAQELKLAEQGIGPTVFDWLVEIIADHAPGGSQPEDGIRLELQ